MTAPTFARRRLINQLFAWSMPAQEMFAAQTVDGLYSLEPTGWTNGRTPGNHTISARTHHTDGDPEPARWPLACGTHVTTSHDW